MKVKKEKPYWPVPKRPPCVHDKPGTGSAGPMDIDFPVFGYRVGIVFSTNVNQSIKYYFSNHDANEDTNAAHCPFKNEGRALVFLPFAADVGTITHEAYHAVRRMLVYEDIGLYESGNDDCVDNETVAYHLGYVVKQIIEFQKAANKQRRLYLAKKRNKK